MKYLPFVWANLWRKPTRTVFTFTSVVLGFTLFGLVLGLNATLAQMAGSARADRIYTSARFSSGLHLTQLPQIAQLPGVAAISAVDIVAGYLQLPANRISVMMWRPGAQRVFPELSLTLKQWQTLESVRDGAFVSQLFATKYGLKKGSPLPIISTATARADGSGTWPFEVLGVVPDIDLLPVGFAVGNYDYLDAARPKADQGTVQQFWLLARSANRVDSVIKAIDQTFASSAFPTTSLSEKTQLESRTGDSNSVVLILMALAAAGVLMIMMLTANALRHSIRERTTELAVMKTLGFANATVVRLVFIESALPCLFGCAFGLLVAAGIGAAMPRLLPTSVILPLPRVDLTVAGLAVIAALLVTAVSAALPVLRITRLDVAAALARH